MSDIGRQSGGRGRGRRSGEPGAVAAPPGAMAGVVPQTEVGRRGVSGRRAETAAAPTITPPEKPQRGSPSDTGSPSEEKMAALDLTVLASRPGFGQLGRKYRMFTNHFELMTKEKVLIVNHYHVEVSHAKIKLTRDDNRPLFWKCLMEKATELGLPNRDELYRIAYDGVSNCYTLNPFQLQGNMRRFEIQGIVSKSEKQQPISVLIQLVGQQLVDVRQAVSGGVGQKVLTPIQVLDIIIRQYRSQPMLDTGKTFYPFRNSIFMIPGAPGAPGGMDLGGGREVWKGLFTSAHVGQNFRALVNMDVDHTAFYKCGTNGNGNGNGRYSAIQFLCDVLNESEGRPVYQPNQLDASSALGEVQCRLFEREIKGLRVCLDYSRPGAENSSREYRVNGLDKAAMAITFKDQNDVEKSVADYYSEKYGPLRFPRMPTLRVGPKARQIHLPIEHCVLARNQKLAKKLSENQTAQMIRQTCMPPAERKRSIEQMVRLARFTEDPFLKNFGLQLSPQMLAIDGRILPTPGIVYSSNQSAQVRDGVWRCNNMRFHMPASAKGIAAIAFGRPPNNASDFVGQLLSTCNQFGMSVPDPRTVFFHLEHNTSNQRAELAIKAVAQALKEKNMELSLIIVFLAAKGSPLYADVKRVAEVQMGVMTQCVVNKTVMKASSDTLANIAFKINMKLGGINCVLGTRDAAARCLFEQPTLLLGIDVTHPGPTDKRSPSIASVVGSVDLNHMRYACSIKVQKQRRESLVYLSDPVTERMMSFFNATQKKPQRIIVYRDGVSEGEFKQVLREELRGIREACMKVDQNFKPKITFIVVQKRHHTRFFPHNPDDGCGKHKNVFPGSTVDTDIVFHEDFNFYLCSHAGIQGTSRPTRYAVLHDDSNFSADDIQMMTYYLCHCFSRCTRAVSIPAPVYFAHLACSRARDHLKTIVGEALSDTASSRSGDQGQSGSIPEEELIRAACVQENMRPAMYFT